jgi:sec-independent protein translocase protein TatC
MKLFAKKAKNKDVTPLEEMTFFDHLDALRWTIFRSMIAVVAFAIVAFIFKNFIFDDVILSQKNPNFITYRLLCLAADKFNIKGLCLQLPNVKLINLTMGGQFVTHVYVSIVVGFIIAFPYVSWEFWKFISPALLMNEKKKTRTFVFYVSLLFFLGVLMGYFLITPISIQFLLAYNVSDQVVNTISLTSWISFTSSMWFATGVVFELPVFVFFLTKLGILTPAFMKQNRKIAIVAILFLAAIITPSPDMFSQSLVAIPLYILYEISIWVSVSVIKNKEEEKDKEEIIASDE